ncbi:MAG TPA: hypothetical protein VF666_15605 [Pyrinomonadaceae bacterium]
MALVALVFCGGLFLEGNSTEISAQRRRGGGGVVGRGDSRLVGQAQSITGDTFRVISETPRGVRVYARSAPHTETLRAIDSGLAELFAIARRNGYRARLNHADYTVFVARPDRTRDRAGAYSPDIAIGAAQYAGSVYDQGGYVFAAGMVLSFQPCAFVIAEHERNWQRVRDVARYEGEHIVLYHNDPRRYQETLDHSRGGSHPILR